MANRSRSGPAHLKWPSISEESIHVDWCERSEVHKETQWQPIPPPQKEGSATNTEGLSYSNRDGEVERLREQVVLLQRNVDMDKELLHRKDKELHHRRGLSPAPSHSQGDECVMDDKNRKRDRRLPYPCGEWEQFPHRERTISPPHHKSRREEQDREKLKGPVP